MHDLLMIPWRVKWASVASMLVVLCLGAGACSATEESDPYTDIDDCERLREVWEGAPGPGLDGGDHAAFVFVRASDLFESAEQSSSTGEADRCMSLIDEIGPSFQTVKPQPRPINSRDR